MVTTITTTLAVGVCTTAIALSAGRIYLASPRLDLSGPRFDLRAATPTAVGRNGIPPSPPPPPAPLAMGIWSATPCGIAAAAPIRRRLACYLQLATAAATGTAAITTTVAATRIAAATAAAQAICHRGSTWSLAVRHGRSHRHRRHRDRRHRLAANACC